MCGVCKYTLSELEKQVEDFICVEYGILVAVILDCQLHLSPQFGDHVVISHCPLSAFFCSQWLFDD